MNSPSLLDFIKGKIAAVLPPWLRPTGWTPWQDEDFVVQNRLPQPEKLGAPPAEITPTSLPSTLQIAWPWRSLAAFGVAWFAQRTFEPPTRTWPPGVILYLVAFALLVWAMRRGEWRFPPLDTEAWHLDDLVIRPAGILPSMIGLGVSFLAFSGNRFSVLNILLWLSTLAVMLYTFWPGTIRWPKEKFRKPELAVTPWTLAVLAVAALVLFFHFYHLSAVPAEMTSDHAEKLLDVMDILDGKYSIFFPRNTGREPIYIYLSALVVSMLGTGISHLSLKISALIGLLLTLPYIYLLGKQFGGRRVGLLAALLTGVAYWPNVFTRFSLRISFYPLFAAPVIYYLLRGLRTGKREYFILTGLAVGLGLMGYTPFRIVPFAVVILLGAVLLHPQPKERRLQAAIGLVVVGLFAVAAALPILRYATQNPDMFAYRAFTRLTSLERPLPFPAWQIFLKNLGVAMAMFGWSNGKIWVHSVPGHPALDVISAALFYLGFAGLLARYLFKRRWEDLYLLLAVPLLLMPSILSLAFPEENPALNRMSGAIVPVFVIVALALEGLLQAVLREIKGQRGRMAASALLAVLLMGVLAQNYTLVFKDYAEEFQLNAWNSSDMGEVISGFAHSVGSYNSAWVIPYPYWVDTRLVGMTADNPRQDYALAPGDISATKDVLGPKLFILKPEDQTSLAALQKLYPGGMLKRFVSPVPGKDFLIFFTPEGSG